MVRPPRRLPARFALAALTALLGVSAATSEARAFCRSSTCRASTGKECPTDDDGCPSTGAKLFWSTSCVSYAVNRLGTEALDPTDTRSVIRKCFQSWSDVPCPDGRAASMTFQERDPVSCKKSEYNKAGPNLNVVLFQDADWKYRGIDGTLAKTSVTFNEATGEIYDADIEVNAAFNEVTITDDPRKVQYDLQSILTHEVGHFIGIAHSSDQNAVMFASYNPGSTSLRRLTPDDVQAVCAAYPPGNGVACATEPRGGFSATCGDDGTPSGSCAVSAAAPTAPRSALRLGVVRETALGAGFFATVLLSVVRGRARRRGRPSPSSGGEHEGR
jgi:hypothetical protein